jgi:acyl carrier protein
MELISMSSRDLLLEIQDIMRDVFDVDDLVISESTSAEDVEEWDSLSHIRLIVAIERKYGFKFKNSEIESLKNVGDLGKLIQSRVG